MAFYYEEPSRTFSEYLLVPDTLHQPAFRQGKPENTSGKSLKKEEPVLSVNIPWYLPLCSLFRMIIWLLLHWPRRAVCPLSMVPSP